ncbi:hypothetical protein GCM10027074_14050 [Streptomyces deserti]
MYAAHRRKIPYWEVARHFPYVYMNKLVNAYYAWKALLVELILVPLGPSNGLVMYEMGRP